VAKAIRTLLLTRKKDTLREQFPYEDDDILDRIVTNTYDNLRYAVRVDSQREPADRCFTPRYHQDHHDIVSRAPQPPERHSSKARLLVELFEASVYWMCPLLVGPIMWLLVEQIRFQASGPELNNMKRWFWLVIDHPEINRLTKRTEEHGHRHPALLRVWCCERLRGRQIKFANYPYSYSYSYSYSVALRRAGIH
jgi:hypothetical protein